MITMDATLLIRLSLPRITTIGSSTETFIRPSSRAQRWIWGPEISDCISLAAKAMRAAKVKGAPLDPWAVLRNAKYCPWSFAQKYFRSEWCRGINQNASTMSMMNIWTISSGILSAARYNAACTASETLGNTDLWVRVALTDTFDCLQSRMILTFWVCCLVSGLYFIFLDTSQLRQHRLSSNKLLKILQVVRTSEDNLSDRYWWMAFAASGSSSTPW